MLEHRKIDRDLRLRRMRVMAPPASMGPFYSRVTKMSDDFFLTSDTMDNALTDRHLLYVTILTSTELIINKLSTILFMIKACIPIFKTLQ